MQGIFCSKTLHRPPPKQMIMTGVLEIGLNLGIRSEVHYFNQCYKPCCCYFALTVPPAALTHINIYIFLYSLTEIPFAMIYEPEECSIHFAQEHRSDLALQSHRFVQTDNETGLCRKSIFTVAKLSYSIKTKVEIGSKMCDNLLHKI